MPETNTPFGSDDADDVIEHNRAAWDRQAATQCEWSRPVDDGAFDIIFHPVSNQYVPDIRPVWRECFRVLRPGGRLLSSFFNPVVFVADRNPEDAEQGIIRPRFKVPYSDVRDLPPDALAAKQANGDALVFGHSLSEQIGGQLDAGFLLKGFIEDDQPNPRFVIDRFMATFVATYAVKP